ncbi:uncharacterized protein Dana_GF25137, isoform A [Drosophila ananassae]|uniref:Uncharacterized protein, isoform A n=1 Tax=Drosophila ananassae TaxID=7217 RepID=B3MA92_DROAN|nr:myosin-G heavy chain isoform X2 [Drosophila ananassae]EDV39106.1 uncharacterized protein Dana_GF25137, isoform A [Drosophila ananassae]
MSCISSNFSSFFLNSLNDPSEFSKYLSNGELKCSNFEEFQVFGCGAGATSQPLQSSTQQQQQQHQQQQHQQQQQSLQYSHTHHLPSTAADFSPYDAATQAATSQRETCAGSAASTSSGSSTVNSAYAVASAEASAAATPTSAALNAPGSGSGSGGSNHPVALNSSPSSNRWPTAVATPNGHASAAAAAAAGSVPQHFDGSFEFIKYLRHSADFTPSTPTASESAAEKGGCKPAIAAGTPPPPAQSPVAGGLIDLDTSTSQKSRSASRKVAALLSSVSRASNSLVDTSSSALDVFDHDSKQTMFDLQQMASNGSSNSNESSLEMLAFPNSHLNASNSNTSSEGAACGSAGEFGGILTGASCSSSTASSSSHAPKLLGSFVIKENFEVHPSHKVEEGIFQHMNKLPSKKKDTLKQLGVRFTGQMTLTDKSIVVENFIKFCEEYDIKDHRPWLSLNQCGLNKPEQIKFARYLGQGLPTFTLFCIYSNFKNLFCTKRTEIYTKDGYNLPYILDKTKRFLANTTAGDNANNNNNINNQNNNNNNNNNNNITNNTSNKANTTTTTTSVNTPVKQTPPPSSSSSQSEQDAPESPATTPSGAASVAVAGAGATPTQPTSRTRPGTPTMPTGGSVTPTTPQQPHLQHQQQHQQHMLQHPHTHSHPHGQQQPLPHPHTHPHPHPHSPHPHSHSHSHSHSHPHHLQPGTPTRSPAMAPHPHHYPPHPHHQQPPPPPPHHGHPHAHHYAYAAHPQQHHPHYYPHSPHPHSHSHPHPHAHVQHMAAMGYPAPPPSSQQTGIGGGPAGGAQSAAAVAAAAGPAAGAGTGAAGGGGGAAM